MSITPKDRQATLSSWMEDVDPKYRSHTHWLMTHNIDPNLYWKWDTVPTSPREGFCADMLPADCPVCRERHQGGCKCNCNSCSDCGMSMCNCRCSQMNRVVGACGHHRGKMLLVILILVALGVLVYTMPESEK